ncbi:MAG: hypothetical protein HYV90_00015 [Candidatus Woesebacteria bacterium]|nr:MAG: hypothetical protein HYV90_00015 [Candidatus Woesebacteria bacterium]
MVENKVGVVVDEEFSEVSGKSYLVAELVTGRDVQARVIFCREADPELISRILNEIGCYVKYDDEVEFSEEQKQNIGDIYIEASYNVPGLGGE